MNPEKRERLKERLRDASPDERGRLLERLRGGN